MRPHAHRPTPPRGIGTLRESSLHAQLKEWYMAPGDEHEAEVEGFRVDLKRGNLLIEIQTRNFAALRRKLGVFLENHEVRVVHPLAGRKWITRLSAAGEVLGRRRSPKVEGFAQLFLELVSIPELMAHPRLSLEALLIEEEEFRVEDGRGAWRRRGQSILDRRLLAVTERRLFTRPEDFRAFLPEGLSTPFNSRDLAAAAAQPRWLAQKMLYCLQKMRAVEVVGRKAGGYLYAA